MEIYVYEGNGKLPSIDFDCLRVITYIKLSNAPVLIHTTNKGNPFKSPNGFLPYLTIADDHNKNKIAHKLSGYNEIVSHLKEMGYTINAEAAAEISQSSSSSSSQTSSTIKDNGLSDAYTMYLFKNLYPCMQYILWCDIKNTDEIKMIYAKKLRFPLNFYYPGKYGKMAEKIVQIFEDFSVDEMTGTSSPSPSSSSPINEDLIMELLITAKKCLNTLDHKLEKSIQFDYALSNGKCEFDVNLYSYLSILFYTNLTNNPLQGHIRECKHLMDYLNKIYRLHLSDIPTSAVAAVDNGTKSYGQSQNNKFDDDQNSGYGKTSIKIFAPIMAGIAMILFALSHGLLQLPHQNKEIPFDDFDDDFLIDDDDHHDNNNNKSD